jgi:protein-S-isoprenylcysteine O-methyltransferase Ste14
MHDLQRQGTWLFRYRSYLPFLMVAFFLVQLRTYRYPFNSRTDDGLWECVCLVIALAGLAIRVYTVGHAPNGTSGRTTSKPRASELNTTGAYSLVRHPLYLGNMLIWLGITLFFHSAIFTLGCLAVFVLYYERIMLSEEAYLRQKFGPAYEQWAKRTPMLLPRFRNWVRPSLPFSWKTAVRGEYTALFVITTALSVLEVLGDRIYLGRWTLDPAWVLIFCVGLATYTTLRTLKKMGILNVAGR